MQNEQFYYEARLVPEMWAIWHFLVAPGHMFWHCLNICLS